MLLLVLLSPHAHAATATTRSPSHLSLYQACADERLFRSAARPVAAMS